MTVNSLEARTTYQIIELKEIETTYGKTFIMTNSNLDKYWSNKKVCDYIKKNKIPLSDNGKILFTIKTGDYKTFKSKDGQKIRYLNMLITN